jgi:hypothetical protein
MRKMLLTAALSATLFSCSSDDNDGGGSFMKSYTVEDKLFYDGETSPYHHSKIRYNLEDGKYYSLSSINPTSGQVQETVRTHFYNGDKLAKISGSFDSEDFIYDAAGNLIATEFSNDFDVHVHWRFVTLSPTLSYAEKLTDAYNVAWTMIEKRIIMEFDANQNVVSAGVDEDIDGTAEFTNYFSYENNNLTGFHNSDGEALLFMYSNVINNIAEINDKTYGKKIARLVAAERYIGSGAFPTELHSVNVGQAMIDAHEYDVLPSRYYKQSEIVSLFPGGRNEMKTTFSFR